MQNFYRFFKIVFLSLFFSHPGYSTTHYSFYASDNISWLHGYTQIPAGGSPGSSSESRPTFDELGIRHTSFVELGFTYDREWFGLYGNYQHIRIHSNHVLDQDLTSHGIFIPSNTRFKTDDKFDLYRLGVNHKWGFFNDQLEIYPEFELTALDFSYEFSIPGQQSARAFHAGTARLGLGALYYINPTFSLSTNAASSIPGTSHLQIQTADINIMMHLFSFKQAQFALLGGVGYERIDFKDAQDLPNHINLIMSPIVQGGIRIFI